MISVAGLAVYVSLLAAAVPSEADMAAAKKWVAAAFMSGATGYPFSFQYGNAQSPDLLNAWKLDRQSAPLDDRRTRETTSWTDPDTGLAVRCEAVVYKDFPTIEWVMYFKNGGTADSAVISKVMPLDFTMRRPGNKEYVLHHAQGSKADPGDYGPRETVLGPNCCKVLAARGGRPTDTDWAYWNLDWTEAGIITAVGWPGQWAAELRRDTESGLRVRAGQELTRFKLLPGEEVRTPLIVLQFWQGGDWIDAQNTWRRWMMAYGMPKPGGTLPQPQVLGCSSRAYEEMIKADAGTQIMFIDRYLEEGIALDYWWMDAGWYVQQTGWPQVGTWEVDPARFPKGLRPVSDYAHSKGIKTLLWFEPERVAPNTWLADNRGQWILGGADGKGGGILNLGNDEARQWLTDHVDKLLTDQGIDLYRQDFNIEPLQFWRGADSEDREGITEIRHLCGYLAYWDELRRRHPGMLIDSCASGGRRNDIETMRRAVPLWRSDYAFEPIGHQCMTYGISLWLPYHGTGTVACSEAPYYGGGLTPVEPYAFWSNAAPSINCGVDMRVKEIDYPALRTLFEQWRQIAPFYYADYYPLTAYSRDPKNWLAWQFHNSETDEGVVQAFRRPNCQAAVARLKMRALDEKAKYAVQFIDGTDCGQHMGIDLIKAGLSVEIPGAPGAAVLRYRKVS